MSNIDVLHLKKSILLFRQDYISISSIYFSNVITSEHLFQNYSLHSIQLLFVIRFVGMIYLHHCIEQAFLNHSTDLSSVQCVHTKMFNLSE